MSPEAKATLSFSFRARAPFFCPLFLLPRGCLCGGWVSLKILNSLFLLVSEKQQCLRLRVVRAIVSACLQGGPPCRVCLHRKKAQLRPHTGLHPGQRGTGRCSHWAVGGNAMRRLGLCPQGVDSLTRGGKEKYINERDPRKHIKGVWKLFPKVLWESREGDGVCTPATSFRCVAEILYVAKSPSVLCQIPSNPELSLLLMLSCE